MSHSPSTIYLSDSYWDPGHPYRFRTWLRTHLPGQLSGLFGKGDDCAAAGGWHRWYKQDSATSGCYHCNIVVTGQLWEGR